MKGKKQILPLLFGGAFLLLCFYVDAAATGVREGLILCGTSVIPALFPFFVVSRLLVENLHFSRLPRRLHRLFYRCFGVSGACALPLLFSFLGGYPIGVRMVCDLYRKSVLSKREAERCLQFCNNAGPSFFVAVIGSLILHSLRAGLILYAIHVLSALFVAGLSRPAHRQVLLIRKLPQNSPLPFFKQFSQSITEACNSLIYISGLILCFSVLRSLLETVLLPKLPFCSDHPELFSLILGCFELTGGIHGLKGCPNAFILSAFLMGWGGLCVHLQAMSLWSDTELQPKHYFSCKLAHGLISTLLAWIYLQPQGINLLLLAALLLCSLFFTKFHGKWTGKKGHYAL